MRLKEPFAKQRKSEIVTYKSKIIIASEGSCSEPKYFEGLNNSALTENKEIINLLRDYSSKTNSHPNFIVSMYKEFLINNDKKISISEVKNKIDNYNRDNGNSINVEKIYKLIDSKHNENDIIEFSEIEEFLFLILKDEIYIDFIKNFMDYFNAQNITYSPETDSINIVIDRDKDNFFENQYYEVVKFCKQKNINLYVSNPNFEFWLMLHFENVFELDIEKMYKNEKVSSRKRYLESQLYSICQYKKESLNFKSFEPYVKNAIENERKFCEDIEGLKSNLGSNVGKLVESILKEKGTLK